LGEAVVPVTRDREVLGPSLLNFDRRGEEFLEDLHERMPDEALYRINGNPLGNNGSLTKLLWIKTHQPRLYERVEQFMHWSGFVSFMLGAEPAVDYSLANRTLLFDLQRSDWSGELLSKAGLDGEKLPRAVRSGSVSGQVSRRMADELGLPHGVVIAAGAHDQCANGIGCGVIQEGQAMYGMGTYICMMPIFTQRIEPALMLARGLNTEQHAVPGQYVSFIYNAGGALLKWYRETFAGLEKQRAAESGRDLYTDLLAEMPAGPSQILALPHFAPTGPPEFISDSSGVLSGLKLETRRGEILKGLLEGTTFYLRECLDSLPAAGMRIENFRAAGGGSKSDAWVQLSADILGRPFERPQVTEAGALGAAILAGTGSGVFESIQDGVKRMVRIGSTFEPDPTQMEGYIPRYEQYRQMWPLMKKFLRQ
jgi:xylulokinase